MAKGEVRLDIHTACSKGGVFGTPPVLKKRNALCGECKQRHDIEVCPDCGADIMLGYGLGFGPGLGPYKVCEKFCGWSYKEAEPEE